MRIDLDDEGEDIVPNSSQTVRGHADVPADPAGLPASDDADMRRGSESSDANHVTDGTRRGSSAERDDAERP